MKSNPTINYISELTGSGKTEFLIDSVVKNTKEYYLIVAPNRMLCDEIYTRFFIRSDIDDMEVINLHQKTVLNPSRELRTLLKTKTKRVIITTHASFLLGVKINAALSDWHLVLDEEMSLYREHEINVTGLTKCIMDKTIDSKEYNEEFNYIHAKNIQLWMNMAADIVNDHFLKSKEYYDLVNHVMNDKYITLVSKEMYATYEATDLDQTGKKFTKFYAMSILDMKLFKSFKSTMVICSYFEKTVSYQLFKKFGCKMNKVLFQNFFQQHPNSDKIVLHYFFKRNWSTYLRKSKVTRTKTTEQLVYEKLMGLIGEDSFLYNANVNFRSKFSRGTLAISTHGINRYKNYTNMVFMPSLNATSSVVSILSKFGLERKEIDFARNVLTAYQFVSRGAVRDLTNEKPVHIYVMDERTVEFLKKVFPMATVEYHETDIKSPKTTTTIPNNVKSFMSRVKKRLESAEHVRDNTLEKYRDYLQQYYST